MPNSGLRDTKNYINDDKARLIHARLYTLAKWRRFLHALMRKGHITRQLYEEMMQSTDEVTVAITNAEQRIHFLYSHVDLIFKSALEGEEDD